MTTLVTQEMKKKANPEKPKKRRTMALEESLEKNSSKKTQESPKRAAQIAWIRSRLKDYREKKGFSQTQFANIMKLPKARVASIERKGYSHRDIRVGTILDFLEGLAVEPEDFFKGCPGTGIRTRDILLLREDEMIRILRTYIGDEKIQAILELLRKNAI